jgi:iron complex transport system permease protein
VGLLPVRVLEQAEAQRRVLICALIFCAAAIMLPWLGPGPLSIRRLIAHQPPDSYIFWQLRLTRTLLALFAGGALSLGGTLFQAVLRDALATPYTLGVSTGASLGAVVIICLGWQTVLGVPALWIGALAGSLAVVLLVMGAAAPRRRVSAFGLLLTGVAVNSVCSSVILLLHSLAGVSRSFSISRWLIGSVDATSYSSLSIFMIVVCVTSLYVIAQAKSWNLLSVGEEWASSRGVKAQPLLVTGYLAGSVLTAAAIALTGPIGFVGLIVPHMLRVRITSDHRVLMPCAFLLGGALLAFCDAVGRVVLAPAEVPAGVTLALLGGPYLIWLVRERL